MKVIDVAFMAASAICATLLFFNVAESLALLWWATVMANLVFVIVRAVRRPENARAPKS